MTRANVGLAARIVFVVAVAVFVVYGLWRDGGAVVSALRGLATWRVAVALPLTCAGIGLTGGVWLHLLSRYGHRPATRDGLAVFFRGQLGKYLPGSVWSMAAQATMATEWTAPATTVVATGLMFLGLHVVTAGIVSCVCLLGHDLPGHVPSGLLVTAALVCAAALVPRVLSAVGRRIAVRSGERLHVRWIDSLGLGAVMAAVWSMYGTSAWLLCPGVPWTVATGAFAVAYVVGVVVVVAPAGVGAREAALVAFLAPYVGVPAAAGFIVLIRVAHTVGDVAWAAWPWTRTRNPATVD